MSVYLRRLLGRCEEVVLASLDVQKPVPIYDGGRCGSFCLITSSFRRPILKIAAYLLMTAVRPVVLPSRIFFATDRRTIACLLALAAAISELVGNCAVLDR